MGKNVELRDTIKRVVKRSMDLVILVLLVPLLIPLCVVLLLGIICEQGILGEFGPLFISEIRISRGKRFRLFKLNMYRESVRKKYILESDEYAKMGTYAYLGKYPGSLLFVGWFMKKYYLDELGQMLNIASGQMTFVGPRPRLESEAVSGRLPHQRLKTGYFSFPANLWKGEEPTSLGFCSDEEYLDLYLNSSPLELLRLDSSIIWDGVKAILKGRGK